MTKKFVRLALGMVAAQVAQVLFLTSPALAIRGEPINMSQIRHQNAAKSDKVRLTGQLKCEMAAENTGAPCDLKFLESGTGRLYSLTESGSAMRLYQYGNKSVTIEGKLANANTIQVEKAETRTE